MNPLCLREKGRKVDYHLWASQSWRPGGRGLMATAQLEGQGPASSAAWVRLPRAEGGHEKDTQLGLQQGTGVPPSDQTAAPERLSGRGGLRRLEEARGLETHSSAP